MGLRVGGQRVGPLPAPPAQPLLVPLHSRVAGSEQLGHGMGPCTREHQESSEARGEAAAGGRPILDWYRLFNGDNQATKEQMRLVYLQDTNEYRLSISFLYPLQHGFQSFAAGFLLFRSSARANLVTTDGTGEGEVMGNEQLLQKHTGRTPSSKHLSVRVVGPLTPRTVLQATCE